MKSVVKKEEGIPKQFLGIDFVVLSSGKDTMVTKMLYKPNDSVPFHKHPNEQSGYIVSGRYMMKLRDKEYVMSEGDAYSIPANIEHAIEIIEAGQIVDVFAPIREDYL